MVGKNSSANRGFPVLAVTRTANAKSTSTQSDGRSDAKSETSLRSDVFPDSEVGSVYSDAYQSISSSQNSFASNLESPFKRSKRYMKKKVPEVHSEMKEAMKFSVQDINDQASSASSFVSTDNKEDHDKASRVDNTRTRLPKPSYTSPAEVKTFVSPVNGVRRSVPLTPGEMELQKVRDSQYVEQVQKKKKFKLNINQLPRSTTPINDHDPDKLNMKQVIAFLQTKTSKEIQKKITSDTKVEPGPISRSNSKLSRKDSGASVNEISASSVPNKVYTKESVRGMSRPSSDVTAQEQQAMEDMRRTPGGQSVVSTKSTPNLSTNDRNNNKVGKAKSVVSVRSFRDTFRERRSERQRPMKEFKLYRFLAFTPEDTQTTNMSSSVNNTVPVYEKSMKSVDSRFALKPADPPRVGRKSRESGTARVLHRHVIKRATLTPPKVDIQEQEPPPQMIRLPVMTDSGRSSPEADQDTCSEHSDRCASAISERNGAITKKGKTIAFDDNVEVNKFDSGDVDHVSFNSVIEDYVHHGEFPVRAHIQPTFPQVNITGPKQIHVNLPQETKKTYSQEIVRLTLRNDKHATRVTSYMSDLQHGSPLGRSSSVRVGHTGGGSDTGQHTTNQCDYSETIDSPLPSARAVNNNDFIKVRQKLKSSVYHSE